MQVKFILARGLWTQICERKNYLEVAKLEPADEEEVVAVLSAVVKERGMWKWTNLSLASVTSGSGQRCVYRDQSQLSADESIKPTWVI